MIMSKKCSLCGSYNTERSVTGTANYALRQAGRFVIAGGASVVVGIFNKYAGRGVASGVWRFQRMRVGETYNPIAGDKR